MSSKNHEEFVVALENQHETLDWNQSESVDGVIDLITEPLLNYQIGEGGKTKLVGALAKSWEAKQGGQIWQIKIQENVKWSDGLPLTSQHVYDGFARLLSPDNPSYLISLFHIIKGVKEYSSGSVNDASKLGIEIVDNKTINFHLKHPVVHFPHLLTFYQASPVRLDLLKKLECQWLSPNNFVGLGPYLVKEHKAESHLKLEANPNYYLGEKDIKFLTARYVKDEGTVLRLFKSGQVDFTFNLPARNITELKKMDEFKLVKGTSIATLRFADNSRKLFPNEIRQAIYWAIERNQIQKVYPFSNPEWYYLPSQFLEIKPPEKPKDLDKLFADAVKPLKNRSINLYYYSSQNYKILCEFIQERLQRTLGLKVKLHPMEWQEFYQKTKENKLPLYLNIMGPDYNHAHSIMEFSHSLSTQNTTNWSSKKYDSLIDAAEKEFDEEKRKELYKKATLLHLKDGDQIPLFTFSYPYILSKKYSGFKMPRIYRIDLRNLKYMN